SILRRSASVAATIAARLLVSDSSRSVSSSFWLGPSRTFASVSSTRATSRASQGAMSRRTTPPAQLIATVAADGGPTMTYAMASAGATQQTTTTPAAAPVPTDSKWNAICRQVLADSHGPTGHGLRPDTRERAGMSVPATFLSLDRCSAVTPCTAHSSATGPTMTAATYTAT